MATEKSLLRLAPAIALVLWAAAASHALPFAAPRRGAPFVPRGGGNGTRAGDSGDGGGGDVDGRVFAAWDRRTVIGVLDLRPESGEDGVACLVRGPARAGVHAAARVRRARFPSVRGADGAASSHAVGSACASAYLLVAYDFATGKTALHRSRGGAQLMAFVDGARCRRHRQLTGDSSGESNAAAVATKLILVLVPSPPSSAPPPDASASPVPEHAASHSDGGEPPARVTIHNLSSDGVEWNAAGARFLARRLAEAFALGGEVYRGPAPFAVEVVGAFPKTESNATAIQHRDARTEGNADDDVQHAVFRLVARALSQEHHDATDSAMTSPSLDEFEACVRQTYEAAGGVGRDIRFE